MSLRTDIHIAFDEVAPSSAGMPERVVETVLTGRKQRGRWSVRLRVPLSLVAVFLLVAVVVSVLVGGRVMQDWNNFRKSSPAGESNQSQLAQLRARPLHLPALLSRGTACPVTLSVIDDGTGANAVYGNGPVYGQAGGETQTAWGTYFDVTYETEPQLTGLVLVRGRDLYDGSPLVYTGQYSAGDTIGSDTIDGKLVAQHNELVLDASHHPSTSGTSRWGIYRVRQGVAGTWSGCTGLQIDGLGFSEIAVL